MDIKLLAQEGNGAVQVEESPDVVPPVIMLAGPIKTWWTQWDSDLHKLYTEWRDAVRVFLVKSGCAVYSPHRAIQGRWNEKLQEINDAAIRASDFLIVLTPLDCIADGTEAEMDLAEREGKRIVHLPPGTEDDLKVLVRIIGVENDN